MKKIFLVLMLVLFTTFALTGCSGKSAYDLAVENGFQGTVEDYLESLKGDDAPSITITDIYNAAVENGFEGTFLDFLEVYLDGSYTEEQMVNEALFSIVSIVVKYVVPGSGIFGTTQIQCGSGNIIQMDKEEGNCYIMTNYHVVYADPIDTIATDIEIYLYGKEYTMYAIKAEFIGGVKNQDVAVLKVTNSNIIKECNARIANIADSNDVCLGDTAYALGNALGLGISLTKGIITHDSETVLVGDENGFITLRAIRTDAAVNGGNSGGALLNKFGQLIGMVSAKKTGEQIDNMASSIPTSVCIPIAFSIINNNEVYKPVLGITSSVVQSDSFINEDGKISIKQTIKVTEIKEDSLAHGIVEKEDIFISVTINGKTTMITRSFIFGELMWGLSKDTVIEIKVSRLVDKTLNIREEVDLSIIVDKNVIYS